MSADEARAEGGQQAPGAASGEPASPPQRALTLKAILAGLAGIVIIGLLSNLNDRVLKLSPLVGNHMPIGAFTLILLLAVVWNPLIGRLHRALRFGTRELAVVLGMMLICSWIPGSSHYRYFHYQVVLPWNDAPTHPQWKAQGTLQHLPEHLFPLAHDPGTDPARWPPGAPETKAQQKAYETVYGSFLRGIPEGDRQLGLAEAPYREWLPVLAYWWPLVLSMGLCLVALIWMLHRQWSHHEQLAYPIASVATSLIERTGSRLTSNIFYSPLFWGGFLPVFLIHVVNNLNAWFPTRVPGIPLNLWVFDHHKLFPVLGQMGGDKTINWRIFFLVIGIAYFIPSEIALSMGLCTAIMTLIGAICYLQVGATPSGDDQSFTLAGAYLAYFLILLWTGRHYYGHVFARALWLRRSGGEYRQQAWAGRIFLLAGAGFVWCLVAYFQLDWFIALVFAASLVIYFLVFARIIAETGIPFLQANFDTGWVLCHLFGFPAIGPGATVMILYLGGVLNPDARECVTPYVANSVKVAENVGVRVPRLIGVAVVGMVVALVVGFGAQTYTLYAKGAQDDYAKSRPGILLDQATRGLTTLEETGLRTVSAETTGLAKLGLVPKNIGHGRQIGWLAFGIAGVLLFALLRFRFAWWPLHPVVFLMWGTWPATLIWLSFLIGWAVKSAVVRFGGGATYQRLKPFFIGMIMGEIVVVTLSIIVGFAYYYATGQLPKSVPVFPG